MGRRKRQGMPADLARVRNRFESWRRAHQPRTRIPEPLWKLAAKLVATHGLHRTASTLKLDYYSLKERVDATVESPNAAAPAFWELPQPLTVAKECVLEFGDGIAVTTRVHLKGYDATEVTVVARSFRDVS